MDSLGRIAGLRWGAAWRGEGVLFLAQCFLYTAYPVLATKKHDALARFSRTMSRFVVPITAVTW